MKYLPRVIDIKDEAAAQKEIEAIGVKEYGKRIMAPKGVFLCVKVSGVRPVAANIIKQEMLSRGGEAAVSHGALDLSVKATDILIFGTSRQFSELLGKLKLHQFGLPELSKEISQALSNNEQCPPPIKCGRLMMKFGKRTYIMGILNVTPDSFSDGGRFVNTEDAIDHAIQMEKDGADIIDIGGESTRPGARGVGALEELKRVIPVIKGLKGKINIPISIDTTKSDVARAAVKAGASMINDISGLHFDAKVGKVAADFGVPLVLMHIRGKPRTMQKDPKYKDLVGEIMSYLSDAIKVAESSGVKKEKIIVDPGVGFGKTVFQNLGLLRRLGELRSLGRPVLVGTSRKSTIGKILDLPPEERVEGTAATVAAAIMRGADIVRVHDVRQMKRVAAMTDAIARA